MTDTNFGCFSFTAHVDDEGPVPHHDSPGFAYTALHHVLQERLQYIYI